MKIDSSDEIAGLAILQIRRLLKRIDEALYTGRAFSNFAEQLFWPQTEVKQFLKSRSRSISLHSMEDGVLEQCESKVIFEEKGDEDNAENAKKEHQENLDFINYFIIH